MACRKKELERLDEEEKKKRRKQEEMEQEKQQRLEEVERLRQERKRREEEEAEKKVRGHNIPVTFVLQLVHYNLRVEMTASPLISSR